LKRLPTCSPPAAFTAAFFWVLVVSDVFLAAAGSCAVFPAAAATPATCNRPRVGQHGQLRLSAEERHPRRCSSCWHDNVCHRCIAAAAQSAPRERETKRRAPRPRASSSSSSSSSAAAAAAASSSSTDSCSGGCCSPRMPRPSGGSEARARPRCATRCARAWPPPGRGRCVSIFHDKNRRYIGKS
jgi:hypothetical protein